MVSAFAPQTFNPAINHHTNTTTTATAPNNMATASTPLPNGRNSSSRTDGSINRNCDTGCKIAFGVLIPLIMITVVGLVVYYAWGRAYLRRRGEKKKRAVEEGIAMRKLGDGGSEVGSLAEGEGGDGAMRDVEVGGEGGAGKPERTVRWWNKH